MAKKKTKVTIKAKKDKKGKKGKKTEIFGIIDVPENLSDRGREIWLAGLGALSTVEKEGSKAFKNLVKKGQSWESAGRAKVDSAKKKIDDATKDARGLDDKVVASIEDAVEGGLHRLGVPTRKEVKDLSDKVDQLAKQVAALADTLGKSSTKKTTRAKSTPAKKSTSTAKKSTSTAKKSDSTSKAGSTAKASSTTKASSTAKASSNGTARTVYHLVPREDDWAVIKEGNERATSVHATKNEALEAGRELAKNQEPSQLVVHKTDGQIQTSYTYGGEE